MTVKELFEKYCKKTEDNEYIVRGSCIKLCPATSDELEGFRRLCREFNVEQSVEEELACFVYDDMDHKYGIGFAGNKDFGEYDSVMEMLEAYLKECYENGWNE